jgi:hypothetical protein
VLPKFSEPQSNLSFFCLRGSPRPQSFRENRKKYLNLECPAHNHIPSNISSLEKEILPLDPKPTHFFTCSSFLPLGRRNLYLKEARKMSPVESSGSTCQDNQVTILTPGWELNARRAERFLCAFS